MSTSGTDVPSFGRSMMPARPTSRYALETEQAYTTAKNKQWPANFWNVIVILLTKFIRKYFATSFFL
jgi:hypothetical protein